MRGMLLAGKTTLPPKVSAVSSTVQSTGSQCTFLAGELGLKGLGFSLVLDASLSGGRASGGGEGRVVDHHHSAVHQVLPAYSRTSVSLKGVLLEVVFGVAV